MRDVGMPETWTELIQEIEREIDRAGYWSGELRLLRTAAGITRFGRANGARMLAGLESAGLEYDVMTPLYEGNPIVIRRAGATELTATIASLLPAIRDADRVVPSGAMWRDEVVAQTAMRAWRPPGTERIGGRRDSSA